MIDDLKDDALDETVSVQAAKQAIAKLKELLDKMESLANPATPPTINQFI